MKTSHPLKRLLSLSLASSLCAGVLVGTGAEAQTNQRSPRKRSTRASFPTLSRYAHDLLQQARAGRFADASANNDGEVRRLVGILSGSAKANPVLLSEASAERSAVVEQLAQMIAEGSLPELREQRVFSLDLALLLAGAQDGAEVATRLRDMLAEIKAAGNQTIVFFNELDGLIGPAAAQGAEVSRLLEGALTRGELRCIGATTPLAFEQIEGEQSLAKLFQPVRLGEATDESERAEQDDKWQFAGDNVASDLRAMMNTASPNERISVILQADDVTNKGFNAFLKSNGVRIRSRHPQLRLLEVEMPAGAIERLAAHEATRYLSPDREILSLGHVETTTGAAMVRSQTTGSSSYGGFSSGSSSTLDGTGVGIAILDSSMYYAHYAFLGKDGSHRVVAEMDFTGEGVDTNDPHGHGTHVAALAAAKGGSDSTSTLSKYSGIASNAKLINLRVLNSEGVGTMSGLLKALDWLLTNHRTYNIRVVNMSLGAPAVDSYKNDPLCRAVRRLADAGIVVVAAAGNDGKDTNGN
ncbi:MAG: S8 family serine peptidase, partial [Acidobacteriota bacterium]|nr:S8 family serine peptidase [Acidobacteriota bacterium]